MRSLHKIPTTLSVAAIVVALGALAGAQTCANGRCPRPAVRYYHPTYTVGAAPAYRTPTREPALNAPAASYGGDALSVVNATRARYGLRPLAHDAGLAGAAATNNQMQARSGLGHHHNPGAWQCAAVGTPTAQAAVNTWLNSPAHRAILLNPSLTTAGIAVGWNTATFNAR
jgi:uncharacterized protein YkwD